MVQPIGWRVCPGDSYASLDGPLLQLRQCWGLPAVRRYVRTHLDLRVELGLYRGLRRSRSS